MAVVIPTRDRPALVARAVASALGQTLAPAEVCVVDDGSDPPVSLAAGLPVRLLRHDIPRGVGAARNAAVAMTTAPLVAFLDDDDEWLAHKLERQVAALEAAGAPLAAVDCGYELWEAGRLVQRHIPRSDRDLRGGLLRRPLLVPSTLLVRRSAFEALRGFREDLPRVEDWDLSVRLLDRYEVAGVPEVLVRWNRSRQAPELLLENYRAMLGALAPRIEALPLAERRRVEAWHTFVEGVYLTQAGDRRAARRALWQAWRKDPLSPRPLPQLVRTVVGEQSWRLVTQVRRVLAQAR